MNATCCHCFEDKDMEKLHAICSDCGGYCCTKECLDEHECDTEGDM